MFKRVFFFLATNIAVLAVVMGIVHVFGLDTKYLTPYGIDYKALAIFSLLWGFVGSIISLLMSKTIAKWTTKMEILDPENVNLNDEANFLVQTIRKLSEQAGIGMPEIGIYDSPEINAFATGAFKNSSLVAVSSGLLHSMERNEIEGVLAHEISHIENGDMITMTLIQGVVNAFVIFFARIAAYTVQKALSKDGEDGAIGGFLYFGISIAFEILFGILASMIVAKFSRWREFRADAGGAKLAGRGSMIAALKRLQQTSELINTDQKSLATMKIADKPSSFMSLFSTHPDLELRIKALESSY